MPRSSNFIVIDPTRLPFTMTGSRCSGPGGKLAKAGEDPTIAPFASRTRITAPVRSATLITGTSVRDQPVRT